LRIKFALSVNWEILIPKINNAFAVYMLKCKE
jgi:hypothetical protein